MRHATIPAPGAPPLRPVLPPLDMGDDWSEDEEEIPAAPCRSCPAGEGEECQPDCGGGPS